MEKFIRSNILSGTSFHLNLNAIQRTQAAFSEYKATLLECCSEWELNHPCLKQILSHYKDYTAMLIFLCIHRVSTFGEGILSYPQLCCNTQTLGLISNKCAERKKHWTSQTFWQVEQSGNPLSNLTRNTSSVLSASDYKFCWKPTLVTFVNCFQAG